jgi:hypothetical protein
LGREKLCDIALLIELIRKINLYIPVSKTH